MSRDYRKTLAGVYRHFFCVGCMCATGAVVCAVSVLYFPCFKFILNKATPLVRFHDLNRPLYARYAPTRALERNVVVAAAGRLSISVLGEVPRFFVLQPYIVFVNSAYLTQPCGSRNISQLAWCRRGAICVTNS